MINKDFFFNLEGGEGRKTPFFQKVEITFENQSFQISLIVLEPACKT